jgi:hypothetical protein
MANITEEHLHHMARRHHATMKKLDGIREKIAGISGHAFNTIETGAGAWLGGAFEGKTAGMALGPLPINLLAGGVLLFAGYTNLAKGYSEHLSNLGNGLLASYTAALGYAFGKRWRETKQVFGGGGHPWAHPYENGWTPPQAPVAPPAQPKTGWDGY